MSLVTLVGASASFAGNPLIQQCHNYNGVFEVLAPGQTDDMPICIWGGASIGALDLVNYRAGCSDQAANTFLASSSSDRSSVCDANGATEVTGSNYDLCKFSDGSMIDAGTLARGASASENSPLVRALTAPAEGPNVPSECQQNSN